MNNLKYYTNKISFAGIEFNENVKTVFVTSNKIDNIKWRKMFGS